MIGLFTFFTTLMRMLDLASLLSVSNEMDGGFNRSVQRLNEFIDWRHKGKCLPGPGVELTGYVVQVSLRVA